MFGFLILMYFILIVFTIFIFVYDLRYQTWYNNFFSLIMIVVWGLSLSILITIMFFIGKSGLSQSIISYIDLFLFFMIVFRLGLEKLLGENK
jgi:hypothetical protein